jgi:hypothetical protein
MEKSLIISYAYHDVDILELRVSAWNGCFGGTTNLYVGRSELDTIVEAIEGFPIDPADEREVTLGGFGTHFAGGATRLRFYCKGGAGHGMVEIQIEGDPAGGTVSESVTMKAPVEAASIDLFLPEMKLIGSQLSGVAVLRFQG